ncbi:hypothetical protein GPALN_011595 [Globodera pallida]|nr:hypothetical protein GPALN_011595 [Globodera pallida]
MTRQQKIAARARGETTQQFNQLHRAALAGQPPKTGLPRTGQGPETRAAMKADVVVKLGGRAAEELIYGTSLGHHSDMRNWEAKARKIVRTGPEWRHLTTAKRTRAEMDRRAQRVIARMRFLKF